MKLLKKQIHFVGIGGIGMSGIAEVLLNMGCTVTGSDMAENAQVEHLRKLGALISIGHKQENILEKTDVVVFSSAVGFSNPEIVEAKSRGIPIIPRAEMLSELMRLKRGIAIAGSHGKTSTTSMVAAVMLGAKMDPTIVVGGRLDLIKSTAALGQGEWLLAEADESDGSFLRLNPEMIVITNIDNDHLDHYQTFDNLKRAFKDFAERIPFYGVALFCVDDPLVLELSKKFNKPQLTYGLGTHAELQARELDTEGFSQTFNVYLNERMLGGVELHVPGRHNVLNCLAAIGLGLKLGQSFEVIQKGIAQYKGVDRRLQRGHHKGALVIDDYGHHPTEVKATLSALRAAYPGMKLTVVFQPHRYTRTRSCWEQFLTCFRDADEVLLLDIYAAGEKPIEGITSKKFVEELIKVHKGARHVGTRKQAQEVLTPLASGNQVILTLGAGDVSKLSLELVALG